MRIALLGYKEFIQRAQPIVDNITNVEVQVFDCFGSEALELANKLERNGIDVIITGQANYYYLKDKLNIPIVVLKVDFVDIVNALNEASKYMPDSVAIAFASFEDFNFNLPNLCKLINTELYQITYLSTSELEEKILEVKGKGVKVLIGTTLAVSIAQKHDLIGIVIYSIENTILRSIERAIEVVRINEDNAKRNISLKTILDNTSEGIISLDVHGSIILANKVALDILNYEEKECCGRFINEIIKDINIVDIIKKGNTEQNRIVKINSLYTTMNIIPVKVKDVITGGVLTFQEISKIQNLDTIVRGEMKYTGFVAKYTFGDIYGRSPVMKKTIEIAKKYAKSNATILIFGESGTGKELFAQSIHNYTERRTFPFVAINCASLPENLLESELFGYEPGAFTGADKKGKKGLFELAHKGTLFLDEIDSIPIGLQGKLLRVIEEREIIHVGGKSLIPIDVRIIASTNKNLRAAVQEGKFRKDLYYRLNILKIMIPPLRERMDDLPELLKVLIKDIGIIPVQKLEPYFPIIVDLLGKFDFPGNIRELKGILNRFLVLYNEEDDNPKAVRDLIRFCLDEEAVERCQTTKGLRENISTIEKQILLDSMRKYKNKKLMAQELGIGRTTLYRKIKNLGLDARE